MQAPNPATQPIEPIPPSDVSNDIAIQERFASTALDLTDGWGRRRLLATISFARSPDPGEQTQDLADRIERAFRVSSTSPLLNSAESISSCFTQTSEEAQSEPSSSNTAFAFAIIEDGSVILAAQAPGGVVLRQESTTSIVPPPSADDAETPYYLSDLLEGDLLALAVPDLEAGPLDLASAETFDHLDAEIGALGSAIWFELTPQPEATSDSDQEETPISAQPATVVTPPLNGWDALRPSTSGMSKKPLGADALRRYGRSSRSGTPGPLRSRMPRGTPPPKAVLAGLLVVGLIFALGFWITTQRPKPVQVPVTLQVQQRSTELAAAFDASNTEALAVLLPDAKRTLSLAERYGDSSPEVVALRQQVLQASDLQNGIVRLKNTQKIGALPPDLDGESICLALYNNNLLLLDNGIYRVSPDNRKLWVWSPGDQTVLDGSAVAVASDSAANLAIATSDIVYFGNADDKKFASYYADWPEGFDPARAYASLFANRLYLLDPDTGEIYVTDPERVSTYRWLLSNQDSLDSGSVGMVVDGGIHVLYGSGDLVSLYEGSRYTTDSVSENFDVENPVAIALGAASGNFYIAASQDDSATLVIYSPTTNHGDLYKLGPDEQGVIDGPEAHAFMTMDSMVVDEGEGKIYWVGDNAIWEADLPE